MDKITFFQKIFFLFSKDDKKKIIGLLLFSIFISIIEISGISIIMPFISAATDFTNIESNKYLLYIYSYFTFDSYQHFIILFGLMLIIFYLFKGIINLFFFYVLSSFTQSNHHRWASKLFSIYLRMPFKNFIQYNTSVLIKIITLEVQHLVNVLNASLMIITEIFILVFIYSFMLWVDFKITILLTIFLLINTLLMVKFVSPKIKQAGIDREQYQSSFYEIVTKSFRNYKMIKLHSLDKKLYHEFSDISLKFKQINIINITLSNLPRLILESISFSLIIAIIMYLIWNNDGNISDIMAKITFFLLSLYRLMPSVHRILSAYNQILFYHKALDLIYDNYKFPVERLNNINIDFKNSIEISNIKFKYLNGDNILKDVNLKIKKNQKIAFIGESGSGKSTLVNLIIGLYEPTAGDIYIDDIKLTSDNMKSWRNKIGYIPQDPYLFSGTLSDNITFGATYNYEKVVKCLKDAKIYDFFMQSKGLDTIIGDDAINLSGGQKQRIAIARALYSEPEILVLDEATSALDYDMEKEIMSSVYSISNNKTLIIIAHRLTTIKNCDIIYKLDNGILKKV